MSKRTRVVQAEPRTRMYCGPNIPGVAVPGLLFTEPSTLLKAHLEGCPALASLVVDPKEYIRVKQAISRKGSLESTQYRKALDYLEKRR